jgi:hypothetical protein
MLEPRTYPRILTKALVLEPAPFIEMAEDDEPIAEGLFLTVLLGALVGVAQLIGGLLYSASLPPADAAQSVMLQVARSLSGGANPAIDAIAQQWWSIFTLLKGYDTGWLRLFNLVWEPFLLLVQWLVVGLVTYVVGRALGGVGTLTKTLGATALVCAPSALLLLSVVPFISVSSLLLLVWSVLITYRAVQVVHELPWRHAAVTAVLPFAVMTVVLGLIGLVASLIVIL